MKFKCTKPALAGLILVIAGSFQLANAGLISHAAGAMSLTRDCSGIETETWWECASATQYTENYINNWELNYASNEASMATSSDNWVNTSYSGEYYSLPEVHLASYSQSGWVAASATYSYQEYEWLGEEDTLTISSLFDFSMSTGEFWAGYANSRYIAEIGIFNDITEIPPNETYGGFGYPTVASDGILAADIFDSREHDDIVDGATYEGGISTSFDVIHGDTFYVYSRVVGSANNGGWVDSSSSLYTSVSAKYSSEEDIALALKTVIKPAPVSVPEPSTLAIFALGMIGLVLRRFN